MNCVQDCKHASPGPAFGQVTQIVLRTQSKQERPRGVHDACEPLLAALLDAPPDDNVLLCVLLFADDCPEDAALLRDCDAVLALLV